MLYTGIALLISIIPWALGVAMLVSLLYQTGRWRLEHHLFIIGSAAYIGYLWLALLMAGIQWSAVPVFSDWLLAWMALSIVICWSLGRFLPLVLEKSDVRTQSSAFQRIEEQDDHWWLNIGLSIWLLAVVVSVFWEVAFRPAVAWDTITFWAAHGRRFLLGQLDTGDLSTMSNSQHPAIIKYVGAWGAFAIYERSASYLYLPWATLYIGTISACVGLGKLLSGRWWVGLISALLMASSPLIQAHSALGGYADLWLGAGLFLSLAWLAAATSRTFQAKAVLIVLISLLITSLAFLKSNSVVYSIVLCGSMLSAWVYIKWQWRAVLGVISVGVLAVLWVWNNGADWSFAGYQLAFQPEERLLVAGQERLTIASNNWMDVGRNFWHVWVLSSSFYLTGVMGIVFFVLLLLKKMPRRDWLMLTGVLVLVGLVGLLGLVQLLNDEILFATGTFERDVTLSRVSQVTHFALTFCVMALVARTCKLADQSR